MNAVLFKTALFALFCIPAVFPLERKAVFMFYTRKTARTNALFMAFVCLILGAVIFFLTPNLFRAVSDENILVIRSAYSSCENDPSGESMNITIELEDGKKYLIEQSYVTDALEEKLKGLEKGKDIQMKIQNQTGYILDLRTDSDVLMDHDTAMKKLDKALALSRTVAYVIWGVGLLSAISAVCPRRKRAIPVKRKRKAKPRR